MKRRRLYINILLFFISVLSYQLSICKIRIISQLEFKATHLGYDNNNPQTNGEYAVVQEFIKPNNIIFDIGANIGDWSKYIYNIHRTIKIYAFEPIPSTYNILKKNLANFNAILFNIALSNLSGPKEIRFFPQISELTTFNYRPIIEEKNKLTPMILKINCETLDNICSKYKIKKINYLKIDTEGHELNVLIGGKSTLEQSIVDIIQFEYGGTYKDAKITLSQVYQFLTNLDYSVFRIFSEGLILIDSWKNNLENYKYSNYLAIKKEFLKNLNLK